MKASLAQIRGELDKPRPEVRLYLLHGPDEAGAMELALRLQRALGAEVERVDIENGQLKANPGRLADEAASMSLFGGARMIRVTGAEDDSTEAFSLLLGAERAGGNPVVAVGPGLKATGKLVKLALASPAALACACYIPEGGDANRLAVGIAREHGMRLTGGIAERLAAASGGDRAVLAREIEKLALYLDAAPERPREADGDALDAIGADLGEAELFRTIDAVVYGRAAELGGELARLHEAGISLVPLLRQLVRKLMTLAELRAEIDGGASMTDATQRIFFRERASMMRALERWSSAQIARAIDRVRAAERAMISSGTAGEVLAEAECAAVARAAMRG